MCGMGGAPRLLLLSQVKWGAEPSQALRSKARFMRRIRTHLGKVYHWRS